FSGLSFTGVDLQAALPSGVKVIALAAAKVMDVPVQNRLLDFVRQGGKLLLYGQVPTEDHEGRPASQIIDALGLKLKAVYQGSA
ncbi:hypothetical protein ABTN46_19635, partial [Acinetobacter baumannii]